LIQYEFKTRKLAQRRPTRSSAVDLRDRWYLSWFTPWLVGLPKNSIQSVRSSSNRTRACSSLLKTHTVSSTLWYWTLATSAANTDTIDNIALFRLVAQTTSFIRTRRTGSTMDDVQLSELYYALSANVQRVYSKEHQK